MSADVITGVNAVGVLGRASGGRGGKGPVYAPRASTGGGGFDFAPVVSSGLESADGGGEEAVGGTFFWLTVRSSSPGPR